MTKVFLSVMIIFSCYSTMAQHYNQLTWVEWGQASQQLKDEFKSVMALENETVYENIIGNYNANLTNNTGRKIYVTSFDVNNDKKKEHAVLSEMDRAMNGAPYHLIYYKDIGRQQVRTLLNDLDVTFTDKGILYHKNIPVPFYVYDDKLTKVKKYVEKPAQKPVVKKIDAKKLTPEATLLFKGIKTRLTIYEQNFIADATGVTLNKAKTKFVAEDDKTYQVNAYTTDMNADGVEEIFVNQSGFTFGNTGNYFDLFFKNKSGEYENVASVIAIPLITNTNYNGYPELLMGGPGMAQNIWRFDGKKYDWNRDERDGEISYTDVESYQPAKNNMATQPTIENEKNAVAKNAGATSNVKAKPVIENVTFSPLAQFLFKNCKTTLTTTDKNELTALTEIIAADTMGSGKKNKLKIEYSVYPVDFNNNGLEEVFVRSTTKFLGIPTNEYSFFVKDASGHYKAAPGKLGHGVKVILNGKSGFPDLLAKPLVNDGTGNLNILSWNGSTYYLSQKITSADTRKTRNIDIEDRSKEYTDLLK